jgi:2-polyprenyl-3-methyl-5-hydroxy-6-metoxy-1,4-benzoquinol methylase
MYHRIFKFLFNINPIERITPNETSLFTKRIWQDHISRYEFAKKYVKKGVLLDIACGEGYGSAHLAPYASSTIGVDISKEDIEHAKKRYSKDKNKVNFVADDAIHFLQKNKKKFDTIVSFETIEHLKEYRKFLIEIEKSLHTSGTFIVSTPNKLFSDVLAGGTFNEFHVKEFYMQEFVDLIKEIFGKEPRMFLQRPVRKNHLLLGGLWNYLRYGSRPFMKKNKDYEGVFLVAVVKK